MLWLARNSDLSIIENELLPLCWEELNHKYVERRLLVSELCCVLAPHLSVNFRLLICLILYIKDFMLNAIICSQSTSRNSLLLSILQQMLLEDKEERVKASAINSIAFIVTFTNDDDKYAQVMPIYPQRSISSTYFLFLINDIVYIV